MWVKLHRLLFGEIFFCKIDALHAEALAVQIGKGAGVRGKAEGQPVRIECLIPAVITLVELAVFSVTEQGMTVVGELGANLMGAPGDQLTFHKRKPVTAF